MAGFFLKSVITLITFIHCVYVGRHANGQRTVCDTQGLNSSHQIWGQAPLPTEPSLWPITIIIIIINIIAI